MVVRNPGVSLNERMTRPTQSRSGERPKRSSGGTPDLRLPLPHKPIAQFGARNNKDIQNSLKSSSRSGKKLFQLSSVVSFSPEVEREQRRRRHSPYQLRQRQTVDRQRTTSAGRPKLSAAKRRFVSANVRGTAKRSSYDKNKQIFDKFEAQERGLREETKLPEIKKQERATTKELVSLLKNLSAQRQEPVKKPTAPKSATSQPRSKPVQQRVVSNEKSKKKVREPKPQQKPVVIKPVPRPVLPEPPKRVQEDLRKPARLPPARSTAKKDSSLARKSNNDSSQEPVRLQPSRTRNDEEVKQPPSMQESYKQFIKSKNDAIDQKLSEKIERHAIVPSAIKLQAKKIKDIYAQEEDIDSKSGDKNEPLDLDLIPGHETSPDARPPKLRYDERLVDYTRSKRTVEMRINDDMYNDVRGLTQSKNNLISQLNDRLAELDKANEEKRELNARLIHQIQFVRDLQASLGTADNGHVGDIIDKEVEQQFREEKAKNKQLKAELRRCEREREEIYHNLKNLQRDLQVTIVTRSGPEARINLEKIGMSLDQLVVVRQQVLAEIERAQKDIDFFSGDRSAVDMQMQAVEADVRMLHEERQRVTEQLRELQCQYDGVNRRNELELTDLAFSLRLDKRKIAGKVIDRAIATLIRHTMRGYFHDIQRAQFEENRQIQSILAFRNLCYKYRERRLRKYIQRWFENGLKPLGAKIQAREVTAFQKRDDLLSEALTKWNHQQIISQTVSSYQLQKIKTANFNLNKLFLKHCRRSFDLWRTCTFAQTAGKTRLLRFIKDRAAVKKQEAFLKWQQHALWVDFQIRQNHNATKFAVLHLKQAIFYEWRREIKSLRARRFSLLVRTWKILNKNRVKQRMMKRQIYFVLKINEECAANRLVEVFAALRQHSKTEGQANCLDTLQNKEQVLIDEAEGRIRKVRDRAERVAKVRAVKKGVVNPFTKVLMAYFTHWKNHAAEFRAHLQDKLKQMIIRRYKGLLGDGLLRWKQKETKKKKRMKIVLTQEMQVENESVFNEVKAQKEQLAVKVSLSKQNGKTKLRMIMLRLHAKELKHRLNVWKCMVNLQNKKCNLLERRVVAKMKIFLARQAFNRYLAAVQRHRQDENNERRCQDMIARYSRERYLKAFFGWKHAHKKKMAAKAAFKRVLVKKNFKFNSFYFKKWIDFKYAHKDEKMKKKIAVLNESVQFQAEEEGETEDRVFRHEKKVKEVARSQRRLGHKTLKKVISQWRNHLYYEVLMRWRQRHQEMAKTNSYLAQSVFRRLQYRRERDAFANWRRNMNLRIEHERKFSTAIEVENEATQDDLIQESRTKIAQARERAAHRVDQLTTEQTYHKQKYYNTLAKLIKDRKDNDITTKKAQLFDVWRQLAEKRARCLRNLQRNLIKNLLQSGFDHICETDYKMTKLRHFNKTFRRLISGYEHFSTRSAMDQWRAAMFTTVKERHQAVAESDFHKKENSDLTRANILSVRAALQANLGKETLRKRVFQVLQEHRRESLLVKEKTRLFQEKQVHLLKKFTVQKWVLRSDQSIIFSHKLKLLRATYRGMDKARVFNHLKKEFLKVKRFKTLLTRAYSNITKVQKQEVWTELSFKALSNTETVEHNKQEAVKRVRHLTLRGSNTNLRCFFDRFRQATRYWKSKEARIKQLFNKQITRGYRDLFLRWKANADMLEVVRFNQEEGSNRMEIEKQNQEIENLKAFLLDRKIMSEKEIEEMLINKEKTYNERIEKSITRLLVFGDGIRGENDNWLKPWCIDRWRAFVSKKKKFRHHLNRLQSICDPVSDSKSSAFNQWRSRTKAFFKFLNSQTKEAIVQRSMKNQRELKDISENIDYCTDELEDLQHQRDYLIEKVILGQRLGLARCRFSFTFAKEKAWERYKENHSLGMKGHYDEVLTEALAQINSLKTKMGELELENEDIAEQNEGLREGAMEGMYSLQEMESIQADVQSLVDQVSQQATTIKSLLEENRKLQEQVQAVDESPEKL